jgi:CRP-like cAMP-binding protein
VLEVIDVRGVLGMIPLFGRTLDSQQLGRLALQSNVRYFRTDSLLMTEGDLADTMFAIVDGRVSVSFHDLHGEEHAIAELGRGDIVGEMALLTGMPRQASVKAECFVTAIEITKTTIEGIFARAPDLMDKFGVVLAKRQAELDRLADGKAIERDIIGRIRKFFGGR